VPDRDMSLQALEEDLTRALGTRVLVKRRRQGGRIVIEYYSDDELQGLYDRLLGSV
jgi:ParB family chromosome partitioning protein